MESRLLLDVVVGKSATVLELLASEDETLSGMLSCPGSRQRSACRYTSGVRDGESTLSGCCSRTRCTHLQVGCRQALLVGALKRNGERQSHKKYYLTYPSLEVLALLVVPYPLTSRALLVKELLHVYK